ncbi:N-acetyltransferase [Corallincola holothuriorum]|uniref:N-acetyltransferase n=1 Tax=Corallincola holothuriorum TaxID=2282215 RepID=A0A368NNI1_9GAMM|nr:GNAT family N-acetyltransferase [Corallincola holothuriorum]RCU51019.1 N-acetyltransferase [Corallincola holothuriorum]
MSSALPPLPPHDAYAASPAAKLVDCNMSEHGAVIREIFNDAILNSTALYEYQPRSEGDIAQWFQHKLTAGHPVIGAVDEQGYLQGFASYGLFRDKPAANQTMEHSVYIHPQHRGLGLGELLLRALIKRAEQQSVHVLVGAIDADNSASIRLHEKLGFVHAGTLTESAFKFDRWLDLALYQKVL